MIFMIVIGIILIIIGIFIISTYNNLIKLRNKVKNSWAHIDTQLQRRFDLIPNLVEVVKGFIEHEEQLLEKVIAIKGNYDRAHTNKEKLDVDAQLSSHLKNLYVLVDNYPRLKSDIHFLKLQDVLAEIEEDISYARQFYNDAVTIYNNKLMLFPNNLIGSMFNFKEETLFDAFKSTEKVPKIRYERQYQCPGCGAVIIDDRDNCQYCGRFLY